MAHSAEKVDERRPTVNVKLRKRHRSMWLIIGIALPLLCLQAIESIPQRPIAGIPITACPTTIGNCGAILDIEDQHLEAFDATLTENDSITTIKILVEQPLKSAFTLAYLGSPDQTKEKWRLLGSIEEMGTYTFEVNESFGNSVVGIIFYDVLNEQMLNSITRTTQ